MSELRLRRIRFKDGRTLEVFRPKDDGITKEFTASVKRTVLYAPDMVGYAYVAWKKNGEVCCNFRNGPQSSIPAGGVPQYAKDILLAEATIRWSKDD